MVRAPGQARPGVWGVAPVLGSPHMQSGAWLLPIPHPCVPTGRNVYATLTT